MGIVLMFVDGIGLAPAGPSNPFAADTAFLRGIVPAPGLTMDLFGDLPPDQAVLPLEPVNGIPVSIARLDACLGVPGLPQSATGQTSLFTGCNAPHHLGRHLSGFPTPTLLKLLAEKSVFRRVRELGFRATFANPFPPGYFEAVASRRRRHATTTAAMLAGGWPLRSFRDLEGGRAVSHDLTNRALRVRGYPLTPVEPEEAGRRLARLGAEWDVVLFEYFLTDRVGHAQDREGALRCLDELGQGVAALLAELDLARHTLVIVSDHGNIEDLSVSTHTFNPVPAVAVGRGAGEMWPPGVRDLTHVADALLRALEGARASSSAPGNSREWTEPRAGGAAGG